MITATFVQSVLIGECFAILRQVADSATGFVLEQIALVADERWLRLLERAEPFRASDAGPALGLSKTKALEELTRGETLGLFTRSETTVRGGTAFVWDATRRGKELASALRQLMQPRHATVNRRQHEALVALLVDGDIRVEGSDVEGGSELDVYAELKQRLKRRSPAHGLLITIRT